MSATLDASNAPSHRPAKPIRVEVDHSSVGEIAELYRALALACIHTQVARVLIIARDDSREGELALRDAATTMVLAGVTDGFRLAIVAASPRITQIYRYAEKDLTAAGIATRLFDNEEAAARWLGGVSAGARQAA